MAITSPIEPSPAKKTPSSLKPKTPVSSSDETEPKITLEESLEQRKKNAVVLAGKYTPGKRRVETFCVTAFTILFTLSLYRLCTWYALKNFWVFICSSVIAMLLADFFSGVVHWLSDTWGTLDTPLVGQTFIRSFREHHLEPHAITLHDFVEINGDNCLATLPFLALTAYYPLRANNLYDLFMISSITLLCFWVMITNQIHKWSHTRKPPRWVSFLQETGIILSRQDHNKHHQIPFDRNYCITNGWLNPWLTSIGFWRRAEAAITAVTGAIPRQDDKYWTKY